MKVETADGAGCRLKLSGGLRCRKALKDPRHEKLWVEGMRSVGSRSKTEAKSRQTLGCPGKAITVSIFARRMMAVPRLFHPCLVPLQTLKDID